MRLGPRTWDGWGCRNPLQAGPSGGREACLLPLTFPELGVEVRTRGQGWRCCWSARWPTQLGSAGPSPPKPLLCSVPPTPARCGGSSSCLGAMGRAWTPACPTANHWGRARCSCRKPLILGTQKGHRHVWTWGEGPAPGQLSALELHLEATGAGLHGPADCGCQGLWRCGALGREGRAGQAVGGRPRRCEQGPSVIITRQY